MIYAYIAMLGDPSIYIPSAFAYWQRAGIIVACNLARISARAVKP